MLERFSNISKDLPASIFMVKYYSKILAKEKLRESRVFPG
jgi:hypothetical protein